MELDVKHQKAAQRERKKPTTIMKDPIPRALVLAATQRNILLMHSHRACTLMRPEHDSSSAEDRALFQQEYCSISCIPILFLLTKRMLDLLHIQNGGVWGGWGIDNRQQARQRFMEAAVRKVLRQRTTLQELMTPKYHKGPLQK